MYNILFIHQNLPGQFRRFIRSLEAHPLYKVVAIGEETAVRRESFGPSIEVISYPQPRGAGESTHHYLKNFEACIRRGQAVARTLLELKTSGFIPDVIFCHPGWGESLFIKDVFPKSKLIVFCEFWWGGDGKDVGFDPEYPASFDDHLRLRIKNSVLMHSLLAADQGVTPTLWQHSAHPPELRTKIRVLHEGIDTQYFKPRDGTLRLPNGALLTRDCQVITYVARSLEPYRGFHVFMRSLPSILGSNPDVQVVIVGGDGISYGQPAPKGFSNYREALMAEIGHRIDETRIHFMGKVTYDMYRQILRVSSLHVYLTYPFVLSWSMLEAMSVGVPVLASNTAPVEEVIREGDNGFLTEFFDSTALASRALTLIERRFEASEVGLRGRASVQARYDFETVGLPGYLRLIDEC